MKTIKIVALCGLAALVLAGHVALWASPEWEREAKLRLTVLNALGWAVVFVPAWAVGRWAAVHRGPKAAPSDPETTRGRTGSGERASAEGRGHTP